MPQIYWLHLLFQIFPEALITILFGYAFQRRKVDLKLLIASVALTILAYIFGILLPIRKETGSILIFIAAALIMILYIKIDVIKAVLSCVSLLAIFIIAEFFNVWVLISVFKIESSLLGEVLTTYSMKRWLYGLPNLVIKSAVVLGVYILRLHEKKNHAV